MITLLPLGSSCKTDSKNMKFTLLSGPPVDKKCEHCEFPHVVCIQYFVFVNKNSKNRN